MPALLPRRWITSLSATEGASTSAHSMSTRSPASSSAQGSSCLEEVPVQLPRLEEEAPEALREDSLRLLMLLAPLPLQVCH